MTVHVLTVGLSVKGALERASDRYRQWVKEVDESIQASAELSSLLDPDSAAAGDGGEDAPSRGDARTPVESLNRLRGALLSEEEGSPSSAELDSLKMRLGGMPPGDDVVVLLSSPLREGLLASLLLAWTLGGRVTARRFEGDSKGGTPVTLREHGGETPAGPQVEIAVVGRLDVEKGAANFHEDAAPNLGMALAWAVQQHDVGGEGALADIEVHAAGGFKATVSYLNTFVSFVPLPLRGRDERTLRMSCLFEQGNATAELPVMRPHTDSFLNELMGVRESARPPRNVNNLEGFGWRRERRGDGEDRAALTPVGEMLLSWKEGDPR